MSRLTEGASRIVRRAFGRPRPATPCLGCGQQVTELRQFSMNAAPPIDPPGDDAVPLLTAGVRFAVIDGQVVLYDRSRVQSHVLNPSAALIWAEVDGERAVAQIVDDLAGETGTARALIDRDVKATLGRLLETHVVELPVDPPRDVEPADEGAAGPDADLAWTEPSLPELETLEWVAAFGPVGIGRTSLLARTNHPATANVLGPTLAGLPLTSAAPGAPEPAVLSLVDFGPNDPPRFRVYLDGHRRWSDGHDDLLVPTALEELTEMAIDDRPGRLLLHAGAVEREGRVVVVAGDSGRGKSTLTAALVHRGFRYLTDEVAAVEPGSLGVEPFAKAIDLDAQSRQLLGLAPDPRRRPSPTSKSPVAVSDLGEVSPGGRLALVVLLMDDDPLDAASTPQSPAIRSMLDLIGCTFGQTFDDESALEWLARVVATVPFVRLPRRPLDDSCAQIEAALDPD